MRRRVGWRAHGGWGQPAYEQIVVDITHVARIGGELGRAILHANHSAIPYPETIGKVYYAGSLVEASFEVYQFMIAASKDAKPLDVEYAIGGYATGRGVDAARLFEVHQARITDAGPVGIDVILPVRHDGRAKQWVREGAATRRSICGGKLQVALAGYVDAIESLPIVSEGEREVNRHDAAIAL